MTRPTVESASPFFIVDNVPASVAFYCERLGFQVMLLEPAEEPFFALLGRDRVMIFVKGSGEPLPNPKRYEWARWDTYLYVPDPDALAAEFAARGARFSEPLKDTHDGLRGFEVTDPDGYVLFFGRPHPNATAGSASE